jgi:hypothetical protein
MVVVYKTACVFLLDLDLSCGSRGSKAVFRFGCEPIEITPAFAEAVIEVTQI